MSIAKLKSFLAYEILSYPIENAFPVGCPVTCF